MYFFRQNTKIKDIFLNEPKIQPLINVMKMKDFVDYFENTLSNGKLVAIPTYQVDVAFKFK